jgi:hypothetical protein
MKNRIWNGSMNKYRVIPRNPGQTRPLTDAEALAMRQAVTDAIARRMRRFIYGPGDMPLNVIDPVEKP